MRVKYTGPEGDSNLDVSRETGESHLMLNGKTYAVSKELGERLLLTESWSATRAAKPKDAPPVESIANQSEED